MVSMPVVANAESSAVSSGNPLITLDNQVLIARKWNMFMLTGRVDETLVIDAAIPRLAIPGSLVYPQGFSERIFPVSGLPVIVTAAGTR